MAETSKNDRSPDDAKADAKGAIESGATKVTLTRKPNGNWDVKITKP